MVDQHVSDLLVGVRSSLPAPKGYGMSERYEKIKKRRNALRQEWISNNGPCAHCGTWDNLEIDHINPATKEYIINRIWQRTQEIRDYELAKCQALCNTCHIAKSTLEQKEKKPTTHGSDKYYRDHECRCDICVSAYRQRLKVYRNKNKSKINSYARNYYHKVIKVKENK
jgi:hypothetical protein